MRVIFLSFLFYLFIFLSLRYREIKSIMVSQFMTKVTWARLLFCFMLIFISLCLNSLLPFLYSPKRSTILTYFSYRRVCVQAHTCVYTYILHTHTYTPFICLHSWVIWILCLYFKLIFLNGMFLRSIYLTVCTRYSLLLNMSHCSSRMHSNCKCSFSLEVLGQNNNKMLT